MRKLGLVFSLLFILVAFQTHAQVKPAASNESSNAVKLPVRVATAAALPANTRSGNRLTANANGALTVNGVAVTAGNRILVRHDGAKNGIYTVVNAGSGSAPWVLLRSDDANSSANLVSGIAVAVKEGTSAGRIFVLTTADPFTINTTSLTFTDPVATAGTGDVVGPASATDNAVARYDSTTGKLLQGSVVEISDTGSVLTAAGSATSPAWSFTTDTNSGWYSTGDNSMALALNGALQISANTTAWNTNLLVRATGGTVSAPSISFQADTGSGLYRIGAANPGLAVSGSLIQSWATWGTAITGVLAVPVGSVSLPSINFGDADTGLYSTGVDSLSFTIGGTSRFVLSTTALSASLPVLGPTGSAAAPTFSHSTDTNSGIALTGSDGMYFVTGGSIRQSVDSTGALNSNYPIRGSDGSAAAPSLAFQNSTALGMYRIGSNNMGASANGLMQSWQTTGTTFHNAMSVASDITPTALSGNVNDYSPTGWAAAAVVRLSGGAADRTITGMAPLTGSDGELKVICNIGTTNTLIASHDDGASAEVNRFLLPGGTSLTIATYECRRFIYDATSTRWRVLN